jgi:ABC-type transport system substrate-binding protein
LWFAPAAPPSRDKPPATEHDRPWLTSETLRLAISAAVDRREYCKQVFYGACDPMAGPVSPANVAWFNPDFPLGQGNPELARAMLAELGLRDRSGNGIFDDAARRPLRFTLLIRRDVPSSARAASFLAGTLKEIGVLIDVTPLSADALAERRRKGAYDAIYDRIEVPDTDPAMNLDFWLSSGAAHVWNSAPLDPERDRRGAATSPRISITMPKERSRSPSISLARVTSSPGAADSNCSSTVEVGSRGTSAAAGRIEGIAALDDATKLVS